MHYILLFLLLSNNNNKSAQIGARGQRRRPPGHLGPGSRAPQGGAWRVTHPDVSHGLQHGLLRYAIPATNVGGQASDTGMDPDHQLRGQRAGTARQGQGTEPLRTGVRDTRPSPSSASLRPQASAAECVVLANLTALPIRKSSSHSERDLDT